VFLRTELAWCRTLGGREKVEETARERKKNTKARENSQTTKKKTDAPERRRREKERTNARENGLTKKKDAPRAFVLFFLAPEVVLSFFRSARPN
jgi:hypothetical protein